MSKVLRFPVERVQPQPSSSQNAWLEFELARQRLDVEFNKYRAEIVSKAIDHYRASLFPGPKGVMPR